jgi:hypothetical protein
MKAHFHFIGNNKMKLDFSFIYVQNGAVPDTPLRVLLQLAGRARSAVI